MKEQSYFRLPLNISWKSYGCWDWRWCYWWQTGSRWIHCTWQKNLKLGRIHKQLAKYIWVLYVKPSDNIFIIPLLCHFVVFWLLVPPIFRYLALIRVSLKVPFTRPSSLIGSGFQTLRGTHLSELYRSTPSPGLVLSRKRATAWGAGINNQTNMIIW